MSASWNFVIFGDILGSIFVLSLAIWCLVLARQWANKRPADIFRQYIFLLTIAIVFFAISRSFGHLIKQLLQSYQMNDLWQQISPFSGGINSTAFIVIFAFSIYFHRFKKVHFEMEQHRNNLEKMVIQRTKELAESNLALATEQERLAVTLQSIGDGVITTDMSGHITLLNKIAEQLTGWSHDEAVGRSLDEILQILDKNHHPYKNPLTEILDTGIISTMPSQTTLITKDGKEISIADSGAPIRDKESTIIGAVLVFRDVTHQLQMEKEILKGKKLESLGVLAGGIAHDFNNILAAMLGNINLAQLDQEMTDKSRHLLEQAEKASLRARDLTQQLITFSKGGAPFITTALLPEVIQESADFVLHGEKIVCIYNFTSDLLPVDIDRGQISRVIQNIIINCTQAMPEGGVIKLNCENVTSVTSPRQLPTDQNYVQIAISDNGPGISDETIDKIFDPYFTTKKEGSGLGLAICHSIITKHNGLISAESSPGKGSTFRIFLPASTHKNTPDIPIESEKETTQKSAKILIMDDEKMIREVTATMLSRLGHEPLLACDGAEAIQLYKEALASPSPVALVLMDLTIPGGMGGKEAVQEILKIDQNAQIIVSSGYSNDPIVANYQEYGFKAALIKPFQFQELMGVLNKMLGQ